MIADKILPSFYLVEVEGKACDSIVSGDFKISKIVLGSKDFENDLQASSALETTMKFITRNDRIDMANAVEQIDFNPEFFPSVPAIQLSEEQQEMKDKLEEVAENMENNMAEGDNRQTLILSRAFDKYGDFVEQRWTIAGAGFKVEGKVIVNPDEYIRQKSIEKTIASMSDAPPVNIATTLH